MPKPSQEFIDSYSTLIEVIEQLRDSLAEPDTVFRKDESVWTVSEIVEQAKVLLGNQEEMPDEPVDVQPAEGADVQEALNQLLSTGFPVISMTREPKTAYHTPVFYVNVTDSWTGDIQKIFSSESIFGALAEASNEMKNVIAFATKKGMKLG